MPKDKFNWVKTNAMVAQPAQLDKFLEPTTDVLLHYQHAHVIKLSTLSLEHAKTAQQDNSVLMEEHANQFHQTVTKMVNSNWASNNAINANHAKLVKFSEETNA